MAVSWRRSFGFAQDDGGFARNGGGPALNENLPTVILRERSEPKDLMQFTPTYLLLINHLFIKLRHILIQRIGKLHTIALG